MTAPTPPLDIEAVERRAKAATTGPWPETCLMLQAFKRMLRRTGAQRPDEDIAFIANAREDIPALIARVRELEETVRSMRMSQALALCRPATLERHSR